MDTSSDVFEGNVEGVDREKREKNEKRPRWSSGLEGREAAEREEWRTVIKGLKGKIDSVLAAVGELSEVVKGIVGRMDRHEELFNKVTDKLEKQGEELVEMRREAEIIKREMTEKVKEMGERVGMLERERNDSEARLQDRIIDQEARSRRNNLIFHGVKENMTENCGDLIKNVLRQGGVQGNVTIERAHRLGRRRETEREDKSWKSRGP